MGFLAYIVSVILSTIFVPIGIIYGFVKIFYKQTIRKALHDLDNKFFDLGYSKDQHGGVSCKELFNDILITKDSKHKFGNPDETISSVLGKNRRDNTLTWCGKALCWILGLFQKDHEIRAIEEDENY